MQPKLTIQERLKDLRVERGLTLEQLSAETGISKSALGKYEADDFKDISPFSMVELAKFYGVSTDYLLGLTLHEGENGVVTAHAHALAGVPLGAALADDDVARDHFLPCLLFTSGARGTSPSRNAINSTPATA